MVDLTPELRLAIDLALEEARRRRHDIAGTEHLFWALLNDPVTGRAIRRCGGNVKRLKAAVAHFLNEHLVPVPGDQVIEEIIPSLGFHEAVQRAAFNARSSEREIVAGPHVLIAMFSLDDCHSIHLLEEQGVDRISLQQYVARGLDDDNASAGVGNRKKPRPKPPEDDDSLSGDDELFDDDFDDEEEEQPSALDQYTTNLIEEAAAGRLDPMVGRTEELQRAIHILARRRKNNPVLVGDAGVGKTAIVEGLALAIHNGDVPDALQAASIFTLDSGALVAGTRFRGEFEERLKKVIRELEELPNSILFVDEIHTLIGAGAASGGALDASAILKPPLARGKLRCIGATTWKEYRQIFERDHALARRFLRIDVGEPTVDETEQILLGLRSRYEDFHGVKISNEAITEAAHLAARYLQDRRLPDKAIDVLDEAGVEVKLLKQKQVTVKHVEQTIARMAAVPPKTLEKDDRQALAHLEDDLKQAVYGQDEAIGQVVSAVKLSRSGLSNPDQPIGSFLFTGPTGVGKTEVAKQLAGTLALNLIRFDMSEYMERHTVSRLIGAPPGYVGFDQGGLLTDAVAKTPHAVVLLDEIEKAHPDVFNLLLQVMDHGTLTDNTGKKTDFRNIILIMTSNVGARDLQRARPGFFREEASRAGDDEREFKQRFSPEFRNRLDARIRFAPLAPEVMLLVARKFLKELTAQLLDRKVAFTATDAAVARLAELGYDPLNGARPMARVIREQIKRPLADDLLFGKLMNGGPVTVDVADEVFTFSFPAPAKKRARAPAKAKAKAAKAKAKPRPAKAKAAKPKPKASKTPAT
jgi:ATP-dependent Clp protease ATP-binding subunit ClpA